MSDEVNAVQCNLCKDIIRSEHRHDFKWCSCGNVAVDGGSAYKKRNFRKENTWVELLTEADIKRVLTQRSESGDKPKRELTPNANRRPKKNLRS